MRGPGGVGLAGAAAAVVVVVAVVVALVPLIGVELCAVDGLDVLPQGGRVGVSLGAARSLTRIRFLNWGRRICV